VCVAGREEQNTWASTSIASLDCVRTSRSDPQYADQPAAPSRAADTELATVFHHEPAPRHVIAAPLDAPSCAAAEKWSSVVWSKPPWRYRRAPGSFSNAACCDVSRSTVASVLLVSARARSRSGGQPPGTAFAIGVGVDVFEPLPGSDRPTFGDAFHRIGAVNIPEHDPHVREAFCSYCLAVVSGNRVIGGSDQ